MSVFKVGQKVMCVNAGPLFEGNTAQRALRLKATYTIVGFDIDGDLFLAEARNPALYTLQRKRYGLYCPCAES